MKVSKLAIFFLFIVTLFSSSVSAQTIDYPRYEVDSLGQKVVVMTIEQAMKLDNNSELLTLFEKLNSQLGEYDSTCIKVINDKEKVISIQTVEISKLKESLNIKDEQIASLQHRIAEYIVNIGILQDQVKNREDVISEKDKQIRGLKTKMIFGGIGSGAAIVGLILGLIFIH
jgi:hypothetical protein